MSVRRDPRVSVITCAYNGERFLRPAIESVLGQGFGDFEYWLVDDASTDGSRDIMQSFTRDPRVRVLETGRNVGAYAAANQALARARGAYVARMDADDVSLPHRLARQVEFLEAHPTTGLLGTAYRFIDERGALLPRVEPLVTGGAAIRWAFLFQNCIAHSTVMYRRRLAEDLGFYATGRYAQDYDLWSRLSFVTEVEQLPEVCVQYRVVASGLTAQAFETQQRAARAVSRRALARLLDRAPSDREIDEFLRRHAELQAGSIDGVGLAHDFVRSLIEPFCRRFGYAGMERKRVAALAGERVVGMIRWTEAEAPRWALRAHLRLAAGHREWRSALRLLPTFAKLVFGPSRLRLARRLRARWTGASVARAETPR